MPTLPKIFHHPHHLFPREFKVLFVAKLLHSIGLLLTHFFIPLFLFELSKTLPFLDYIPVGELQQGLIFIGGYFIVQRLLILLVNEPLAYLIARLGSRTGMVIGQVFTIVSLIVMQQVAQHPWLLLVTVLIEAIKMPLFWSSYYALFSQVAVFKHMGKSVGTVEFFIRLIHVAIPAISGIIIAVLGFSTLFVVGIGFHILSILCLFFVQDLRLMSVEQLRTQLRTMSHRHDRDWILSLVGRYIVDSLQFLWPFFVVFLVGSVQQVGFLYSFVFFISLLCIYFTGWYIDHTKSRRPFMLSGYALSAVWLGRAMVQTPWGVIGVDVLEKLFSSVFTPFYDAMLFRKAKTDHTLAYFVLREKIISLCALVFWGCFILYFAITPSWQIFMALGSIGMLLSLRLHEQMGKE